MNKSNNTMSKIYQHMAPGLSRPSSTAHMRKGMIAPRSTTIPEEDHREMIYLRNILGEKAKLIAKHYGLHIGRIYDITTGGRLRPYLHKDPEYKELKEEMESIGFPAKWENMKLKLEDW